MKHPRDVVLIARAGSKTLVQIVSYGLVGLVNAAFTLAIIFGAMSLGIGAALSNALGYAVGLLVSFFLNSKFTFRIKTQRAVFIRFLVVAAISYAANLVAVITALRLSCSAHISQLLGVPVYTAVGFLANKYWAMKKNN